MHPVGPHRSQSRCTHTAAKPGRPPRRSKNYIDSSITILLTSFPLLLGALQVVWGTRSSRSHSEALRRLRVDPFADGSKHRLHPVRPTRALKFWEPDPVGPHRRREIWAHTRPSARIGPQMDFAGGLLRRRTIREADCLDSLHSSRATPLTHTRSGPSCERMPEHRS